MMTALKLSDIAPQIGGTLKGDARFDAVATDSRSIRPGQLFVALAGDHFDGNEFVAQVADAGAAAAVVSKANDINIPQLVVADTRLALGLIARINRRQFQGPVIALTGSAGKTTCKEMIAAILAQCGEVLATRGNLNNEIGVPLTLLSLSPKHRFAVIEMGASRADDIRYLTQFAEPTIALVTNALPVHIEGFGNLETVAKTKGQVFESVAGGGTAIINMDDTFAAQWQQQAGNAAVITYSLANPAAHGFGRNIELQKNGTTRFVLCTPAGEIPIQLQLLGAHNVRNAIAAAAAAMAAGAKLEHIRTALEQLTPVKGRLQAHVLSNQLLIDDTYNANPAAVKAAIDVLANFHGVRCLVLGAMAELGPSAQQEHDEVAAYAKACGIDRLLLVGQFAEQTARIFGESFDNVEKLLEKTGENIVADVVLVKGSRSAAMERVVAALIENDKERGAH